MHLCFHAPRRIAMFNATELHADLLSSIGAVNGKTVTAHRK